MSLRTEYHLNAANTRKCKASMLQASRMSPTHATPPLAALELLRIKSETMSIDGSAVHLEWLWCSIEPTNCISLSGRVNKLQMVDPGDWL